MVTSAYVRYTKSGSELRVLYRGSEIKPLTFLNLGYNGRTPGMLVEKTELSVMWFDSIERRIYRLKEWDMVRLQAGDEIIVENPDGERIYHRIIEEKKH